MGLNYDFDITVKEISPEAFGQWLVSSIKSLWGDIHEENGTLYVIRSYLDGPNKYNSYEVKIYQRQHTPEEYLDEKARKLIEKDRKLVNEIFEKDELLKDELLKDEFYRETIFGSGIPIGWVEIRSTGTDIQAVGHSYDNTKFMQAIGYYILSVYDKRAQGIRTYKEMIDTTSKNGANVNERLTPEEIEYRKGKGTAKHNGPTEKTKIRFEIFRKLKDNHKDWSYEQVAMKACAQEHMDNWTGETVRNTYKAMGKEWEKADRVR